MSAPEPVTTERSTRLGVVRGVRTKGVDSFWGLRYAQPVQRFQRARPATAWAGVYEATQHKPMAPQMPSRNDVFPEAPGGYDEDCLYLNVHSPVDAADLPVFVWIHGGAMVGGAANQYDGTNLATGAQAVVVCINYRLGIHGFLDMSEFGPQFAESRELWLHDQIEALRWVRDSIRDFGGDPGCITIAGESAGATSVLSLCAAPTARGLFHRAMANSGGPLAHEPATDQIPLVMKAKRLATRTSARDYLLSAPAQELVELQDKVRALGPTHVAGSPLIPAVLDQTIRSFGPDAPPLISGYASHEGDMLAWAISQQLRLVWPLRPFLLHLISRVVAQRTAGGRKHVNGYLRRLRRAHPTLIGTKLNDLVWTDTARKAAVDTCLATTEAGSRGYVYELDLPMTLGGVTMRSTHGVDIALTFNTFEDPAPGTPQLSTHPGAPALATAWVAMLHQFIRTGDPSGPLGEWPMYDADRRSVLFISPEGCKVLNDPDPEYRTRVWR